MIVILAGYSLALAALYGLLHVLAPEVADALQLLFIAALIVPAFYAEGRALRRRGR